MLPPVFVVHEQSFLLPRLLVQGVERNLLGRTRDTGRKHVLGKAPQEVSCWIVVADYVNLAVPVPGHANTQLCAIFPHNLGEMASLQSGWLLSVLVLRFLGVPTCAQTTPLQEIVFGD